MIFVTLGSQKFQFDRLLKEIDILIEDGNITEEVFAQVGYSYYKPQNYNYKEFLDRDEFRNMMDKCDKVITHGGTGAIIDAVKKNKKIIGVPRISKYKEHVDDHQIQIVTQFESMGFIFGVYDIEMLSVALNKIKHFKTKPYVSNTNEIIKNIDKFLNEI